MSSNNVDLLATELDHAEAQLQFLEQWLAEGKSTTDYIKLQKDTIAGLKLLIERG